MARALPFVSSDPVLMLPYVAASSDSGVWLEGKLATFLGCSGAVLTLKISKGGGAVPGAVPGPRFRRTVRGWGGTCVSCIVLCVAGRDVHAAKLQAAFCQDSSARVRRAVFYAWLALQQRVQGCDDYVDWDMSALQFIKGRCTDRFAPRCM